MISHQIIKKCYKCKNIMKGCVSRIQPKIYCSRHCAMTGNLNFLGKLHSIKTKNKMRNSAIKRYEKAHILIKNPSYANAHSWLRSKYGRPNWCEKCKSIKIQLYDWALKHNKKHQYNRNNYIRLCRKCHHQYDNKSTKCWITRKITKISN